MTENLRKRVSKWDLETDTNGNVSSEIRQDYLLPQKSDVSLKHQETNLDWNSSKCDIDNFSEHTVVEGNSTVHLSDSSEVEQFPEYVNGSSIKTFNDSSKISECTKHCDMEIDLEDDSKKSHQEPISENKNKAKGGSDREAEGRGAALDRPYRRNMSPGVHRQRRRSWSSSPRSRRDRSRRSRSRSRSWSRSHSRSRSRSRSHSPSYRSRRGSERWVGRQRVVSRGSEPCRNFTTGRCRRGSQCRFLHDDGRKQYEKHSSRGTSEKGDGKAGQGRSSVYDNKDSISSLPEERDYSYYKLSRGTSEKGDGKAGQGRSSVYDNKDSISSLPEERDYSYYKLSHRHENQYDGDQKKSELHNRSSERCYDFTKGRCQRGSGCRFVHHDVASQGGLHAEDEAKEKKHRRRDADASFQQRIESHKADDTPCKFFAEGHCHRGDVCRFSHQDMAHVGSKEKLRSGNRLGQDVIVLGVSNSGDRSARTYLTNSSHQMSAAAKGASLEFIGEDPHHPKYTNPMENNYENVPQEALQRPLASQLHNGAPITSERHQQVAAVPTQSMPESTSVQQSSVMKGDMPAHGEGSGVIPFPGNSLGQTGNHHAVTHPLQDQNFTPNAQIQQVVPSFSSSGQTQVGNPLPLNQFIGLQVPSTSQNFNIGLQSQAVLPLPNIRQRFQSPMLGLQGQQNLQALQNGQIQQNYNLRGQNQQRFPTPYVGNNQQKMNLNGQIQHNIPLPPHIPHGQPVVNQIVPSQPSVPLIYGVQGEQHHDFSSQSQQSLPSLQNLQIPHYAHGSNGQHQHVALQPPPYTRNLKSNEQSHQNSHQQMQTGGDKLLLNVDIPTKPSESNSDTTITPKEVTSEQAAQISNLSASLAQFFGSGQNIPKLYATLNPLSVVGSAPSPPFLNPASTRPVAPAAIPTISILPGQGSLLQQHQDSASGSVEPLRPDPLRPDTTNAPPGFSANSLEQKDGGDLHQPGIPDGEHAEVITDTEIKEVDERQTVQSKKEQANRSEDADPDPEIRTDGESKKGKDAKGVRMFKCALVEFVKDLLKPHWKDGLLSKEVHKTIVKKVVDKVTVVMQSGTVPQTPEKIDQYLTHSKPKLSKLVQAYMDKYA